MDDNMIFKDLLLQVGQDIFEANENQQVTYRCLNERANQLAHLLRMKGVKDHLIHNYKKI